MQGLSITFPLESRGHVFVVDKPQWRVCGRRFLRVVKYAQSCSDQHPTSRHLSSPLTFGQKKKKKNMQGLELISSHPKAYVRALL